MNIAPARRKDAAELSAFLRDVWRESFPGLGEESLAEVSRRWHSPEHLSAQIEAPEVFFAAAREEDGTLLGLVTLRRTAPDRAFLHRLYVAPGRRSGGVGAALLDAALSAFPGLRSVRLEVLEENAGAVDFYRRKGFGPIGRREEPLGASSLRLLEMELCPK